MKSGSAKVVREILYDFIVEMSRNVSSIEAFAPISDVNKDLKESVEETWGTLNVYSELLFGMSASELLNEVLDEEAEVEEEISRSLNPEKN